MAAFQRRGAVEDSLRRARTPMYEQFMAFFFERLFAQTKGSGKVTDRELQDFFAAFTKQAIVLSSDRFVREWSRYRRKLVNNGLQTASMTAPNHLLIEFEKVLLEIRRDFGHRNRGLKVGDVLGMWVNDVPISSRRQRSG